MAAIKGPNDLKKYIKGKTLGEPAYRPLDGEMEYNTPEYPCFWIPLDRRLPNTPGGNSAEKIVIHAVYKKGKPMSKNAYKIYNSCFTTTKYHRKGKRFKGRSYKDNKGKLVEVGQRQVKERDGTADDENWKLGRVWYQGNYRQASGHYTVFQDGEVIQHAPETNRIGHAGGAPTGFNNKNSVGIEFLFGYQDPNHAPTDTMYKSGAKLVKDICKRRNIPIDREHITYHKRNPGDPGVNWNWDYFFSLMKEEETPQQQPVEQQPPPLTFPLPSQPQGPLTFPLASTPEEIPASIAAAPPPGPWAPQQQTPPVPPPENKSQSVARTKQSTAAPPASTKAKETNNKKEEEEKKSEIVPLSDEEVKASLIGFYLPTLISKRGVNDSDAIIHLETDSTTSYVRNLLFAKGQNNYKDFSEISTLEMSSLVPFIELYSIEKYSGSRQKHTLYPFDDYTNKTKLDSIFADKTGRGGNVGIEEMEWQTIATNPSNVRQISVSLKIRIQDIQEIETLRNGITLLDFLYPGGSRESEKFNTNSFNVKIRVGWNRKRNKDNQDFSKIDKMEKNLLSEFIYATLHKHSFDFESDGSVLLNLEYYGMLETAISDPFKFDVLKKLNPKLDIAKRKKEAIGTLKTAIEKKTFNIATFDRIKSNREIYELVGITAATIKGDNAFTRKHVVRFGNKTSVVGTSKWDDKTKQWVDEIDKDQVEEGWITDSDFVNYITEEMAEETDSNYEVAFLDGISNLLQDLSTKKKINWIRISKEQVEYLKQISEISQADYILKNKDYKTLKETLGKVRITASGSNEVSDTRATELLNTAELSTGAKVIDALAYGWNVVAWGDGEVQENVRGKAVRKVGGKVSLDAETFEKELLYDVIEEGEDGDLAISYVYFGDILNYYMNLFFEEKSALDNKELRLVVGTFSYRDIGQNTADSTQNGQGLIRNEKILQTKNGKQFFTVSSEKKYANIADIPISTQSLLNWYNSSIIDTSLERMSFNKFIRSLFNNLIPANLANNILSYGPKRTLLPGFNYITTERNSKNESEIRNSASSRGQGGTKPKYRIEIKEGGNSSFIRLRDKIEVKGIEEQAKPVTNYLFITSLSERDANMVEDYKRDLKRGIFHFYVGEEKGLVKEIKFTREDNEKLDAANLVKANKNTTETQIIRQIYNAKITLFGNTIFYPGQIIHISPTFPGTRLKNKTLYKVGLGGYFQIIKINNVVTPGGFETVLDARWVVDGRGLEGKEFFLRVEKEEKQTPGNDKTEVKAK